MELKNVLKIFLVLIFVFGVFSVVYADSGPTLGANQAQKIAQSYLKTNNLPYTAVTPGWSDWKAKVTDTKTGAQKWIPVSEAKADDPGFGGPGRYTAVEGYNSAWVVQVNNQNGKNVGRIYVDAETGKVLKAIIDQGSNTNDADINATPLNQTATQDQGILGSIINSIMSFLQQIWTSIFGK
ncbi:MAG: hypothetical protein HZC47_09140 [Methanobacterium sp.]|uniref:hypothetical protein n=1 Tax=Methanobacterium sp. TaxID=2164 RepID=UPI003D648F3D|nr:hypothetical protein [Methanobacterium sp.]